MSLQIKPCNPRVQRAVLLMMRADNVSRQSMGPFLLRTLNRVLMASGCRPWLGALMLLFVAGSAVAAEASRVTLKTLIETAQAQDPWIAGSFFRQAREEAFSRGAVGLPAPTVTLGMSNLPVNSFHFDQEPMTQFKLGVQQRLPRGRTLELTRQKFDQQGLKQMHSRAARKADIVRRVSHLYLEVFRYEQMASLIENDLSLFDQLIENALSQYTTGALGFHQQGVIQAQTQRSRLIDRFNLARQQQDQQYAALSAWFGSDLAGDGLHFAGELAQVFPVPAAILIQDPAAKAQTLAQAFAAHPLVRGLDEGINAAETETGLAAARSKAQWGLNASYGQRQDSALGVERADFLSFGVSFDLPMINRRQQNSQVTAAIAAREGVKTDRALLLRQIKSGYDLAELNYGHLFVREQHFASQLLKQVSEEAAASLAAYTTESGSFSDVLQASISGLKIKIDALNVEVDRYQSIVDLNYYLVALNPVMALSVGATSLEARSQRTVK